VSEHSSKTALRNLKVRRIILGILITNWMVAVVKMLYGVSHDAASVTADGLHSFIDGSANVIGLLAMSVASQPADEDHPYGHGKFEALASLGVGVMVGVGGLELARMAWDSLFSGHHPTVSLDMVAVMVGTLFINLGITAYESHMGRKLNSTFLVADAQHTLSDVGITLAVLGSLALVKLGYPKADGLVAFIILGLVGKVAYGIVRQSVGILSDSARLDPSRVIALAQTIPDVLACKDVRSRGMEESVYVDLKIEVAPALPTAKAHEVAHAVEQVLSEAFPQVVDVVVHVEPSPQA
jgi:cation diffusion facilitator family transporter